MVKMVKNRVTPARNTSSATTTEITSDPFFSTSKKSRSKNENVPSTSPDQYNDKPFNKYEMDGRSKNIHKAKNVREGPNKFNFKNKGGNPTKFGNKIKNNKSMPKFINKPEGTFKQIEEDSEYNKQAKNKCRDMVKYEGKISEKKPFDKKKFRLQKYSKKYKLDQWEEQRKKTVLREYYQQTKDDKPKLDINKIYEQYDSDQEEKTQPRKNYVQHPDFKPAKESKSTKKKVQLELERIKEDKEARKEEIVKKKQEKEEALKLYRQKKNEKQKQLNKKTKRGQPVMKGRIEMLLNQIQNS